MDFKPQLQKPKTSFRCSNNEFKDSDIIVDPDYVVNEGQNTVVKIVVNQPGKNTPVSANVVTDALHKIFQDDNRTAITNLQLAIFNTPNISNSDRENALRVRLFNIQASQVSITVLRFVNMNSFLGCLI